MHGITPPPQPDDIFKMQFTVSCNLGTLTENINSDAKHKLSEF